MDDIKNWPTVSFIVCTLNCRDYAKRCFESIKAQDYPNKIEMIAVDSYSKDGTIEILKQLDVKVIFTEKRPEGKGSAKWLGYKESKHDVVIFIDSDNKLVENDWTKKMVYPLVKNDADFSMCRMAMVKTDKLVNQYLSLVGTDPFLSYASMDSQLAFKSLKLEDKGDYYIYRNTVDKFLIAGGYYFTAYKRTLDKIGGYTQDTDVVYFLAKNGLNRIAIPKDAHLHHLITTGIINFTKKKKRWADIYFEEQIHNRDFHWMPQSGFQKIKLYLRIFNNLLFIPNIIYGVYLAIRDKEKAWLLHPLMVELTTSAYITSYIYNRFVKGLSIKPN